MISILLLLTLLVPNVVLSSATREVVSFDFGWKHRTGLTDWANWDDPPPQVTDPGVDPPEAAPSYDDSTWWDVQVPHDGLIVNPPSTKACPDGCSGRSYIPRHVLWYRKTFAIPNEWRDDSDSVITLEFEGSFRNTTVWWNGRLVQRHICGYTPFRVRLNFTSELEEDQQHTIAVFVDPDNGDNGDLSHGSGWWYEGGGIYRHVKLIRTHALHVEHNSLVVRSNFGTSSTGSSSKTEDVRLDLNASIQIPTGVKSFCYNFTIQDPDGKLVATSSYRWEGTGGSSLPIGTTMEVKDARFWTIANTNLYQADLVLMDCTTNSEIDRMKVQHGIRRLRFDPNDGFFMNGDPFKIRGFCDHDTFAVVGMAVPDRINLFRAQASRSIGGNGRRASHNPPDPSLLDIYDRLGIVVIDENRLFGDNNTHPEYVQNMAELVLRDRNHPSVVVWSFCNEANCEGPSEVGGPAFQDVVEKYDGTRPSLANMWTFNDLLSNTIDVQGFSHQSREKLDNCHATLPHKPILMSECCSCNTMRGEDEGCETRTDNPQGTCNQTSFNARCLENQVNASEGAAYAAGTMIWTLLDYYGEPSSGEGKKVSSSYGQFDLCGFPKAAALWFRSQWLLGATDGGSDKPFPTNGSHEVYVVESWESPDNWIAGANTKSIHVYTNAPFVELFLNGESKGTRSVVPMVDGDAGSYAEWADLPWQPGTLTAVARSASKSQVATFSRSTNTAASALLLSLDCPSEATGTGAALLLDGQDVALVRVAIVDSNGNVMHMATNNITFTIVSGPGRIQGTANGDVRSFQPHSSNSQTAYHGLVRAVVRVTSTAGLPRRELELMAAIDNPTAYARSGLSTTETDDIVIQATSPGFQPVTLTIATTTDVLKASVLAVAKAGAGKPVEFFQQTVEAVRHPGLDLNIA